jgi:quercetin dioxygenase-like cupin family protein
MTQESAFDREAVGLVPHSFTKKVFQVPINAFIVNGTWKLISKKVGKFVKAKSDWVHPYKKEHPTDKLKVKLVLNEPIKGNRIVGLKARIEAGHVHQLHIHENEYVVVYSLKGKCLVTVGSVKKTVLPNTMIFIPPKVPHRFYNKFSLPWEGLAFAIGTKNKIRNVWLES